MVARRCSIVAGTLLLATMMAAPAEVCAQADPLTGPQPRVEWSPAWPRFRLWEYAGTAVLDTANWYLFYYKLPPSQPHWRGANFIDDTVRGWLRAETTAGRVRAGEISDRLALGRYIVPFGIDLPVVLLVHRQLGVTWQLLMMDLEAFAVAGFITNVLFDWSGRSRPDDRECAVDPRYDPLCGRGNNASFPSGHTQAVATAAGLTCVHHRYLPIYGNSVADGGACAVMSLAAAVTAVTRVMSDRHYTTDVVAGAAIGFAAGYGLPWLLHYRARGEAPGGNGGTSERPVAVLPFAGPTQLGVSLSGAL